MSFSSSSSHLLCPMCLLLTPSPVCLPCGHSFCLPCLQTMDRDLDRHCCPRCRQEYHPDYYNYYYYYYYDCDPQEQNQIQANIRKRNEPDAFEEEIKLNRSCGFQNKAPHLTSFDRDVQGSAGFQNETQNVGKDEAGFVKANEQTRQEHHGSLGKSGFQNKTALLSAILEEDERRRVNSNNLKTAGNKEVDQTSLDDSKCSGFQNKSPVVRDSELYDYLKSKMVESDYNLGANVTEEMTREGGVGGRDGFQNKETTMAEEAGLEVKRRSDFQNKTQVNERQGNDQQKNMAMSGAFDESESASKEHLVFQNKSPISEEDEKKMAESKVKLTSRVANLTLELERAESLLKREREYEINVTTANAKLRENVSRLAGDVASFARNFSERIVALTEREFGPGEAAVRSRVANASEWTDRIRKAMLEAEDLLREEDPRAFASKAQSVESEMERCEGAKRPEEGEDVVFDLAKLCPELERLNGEFREKLGQVQRSLRSAFNPSEVTFDPETLHPNLVLSEDLKTVTFSAKKQPYAPSPKRFASFFQVLSLQSFSGGVHRWEVELDGAPWMLGVCVASALPRSGLPSALESCPWSWALMWKEDRLTALGRGRAEPLKKTCGASRRLQVALDRESRTLSFHQRSLSGQSSLIHSFSLDTEEPLHLAFRMLSGETRGRISVCS